MSLFLPEMELALDADLTVDPSRWSWWNYSDHVHKPAKMIRRWGRQDRYSQIQPAQVNVTLINDAGIFVPDNPASPLYGLIDLDTPMRILNRPIATNVTDAFARTSVASWGTADGGGAWTNVGTAGDYSVSTTNGGRHTHTSAAVAHYSTQPVSLTRVDITVRVRVNAASTGAAQTAGIVCRYVDANNSRRGEVQFGVGGTITGRIVIRNGGVDSAYDGVASTLTHSTTAWYWVRLQTGHTSVRLKVWPDDGTAQPRNWLVDGAQGVTFLDPVAGPAGVYSMRETGNTNASATIDFDTFAMLDGPYIMQTVYVDGWPTEWSDESGNQSLAPIVGYGKLAGLRIAKGLKSAAYRAHTLEVYSAAPVAVSYHPMEDSSGASQFASGLAGKPPMVFTDMSPGSVSMAGSDPLPNFGGAATFSARVAPYPASTQWAVRALMRFPTLPSVASGVLAWTTNNTISKWVVVISPGGTWTVQGYVGGTDVLGAAAIPFTDLYGATLVDQQFYLVVNATQNGANIDWGVFLCTGAGVSSSTTGSTLGVIGNVTSHFHSAYPGYTAGGYTIGHVAVASDTAYTGFSADIASGYAAETTQERLDRLGLEENIPVYFGEILGAGTGTTTQQMGAQRTTTLFQQLQQVEATESGLMFDGRQGHTTILPRSQRGNHTAGLILDISQGHVAWPFKRTVDAQLVVNDVTVDNIGGSKAVAQDAALVRKIGVKPATVSVNTLSDTELDDHANWWLHVGTHREARYPQVALDFVRNPDLIADYLESDVGYRVQVTNLPGELPPDDLDLTIEGGLDVMDDHEWTSALNMSSASVWDWWTVGDTLRGRAAPSRISTGTTAGQSAAQLLTAATSSATNMLFATLEGRRWSTTATPYHVKIAGEKVTVTAMGAVTSSFVAAGTGGSGDNTTRTPALPVGAQLGDLLLIFAVSRNTLVTITDPTGYERLLDGGHIAVFGKIHTGSESVPSVAFSGGSAGDTTTGQMAAFRGVQCRALYTDLLTNSSAQNIAVPAMLPPEHDVLALWLGWKQDDWTSVATLFGTEIGEVATTVGNDQGLVWDYQFQTTAAETVASSFVVTGGLSAVSKGAVLVLPCGVQSATVTRGVNGVSKAQTINTPIELWKPGVLKL